MVLRARHWVAGLILLPVLLLAVAVGYLAWIAKIAEPRYDGDVWLPGLTAPVTIRYGPHAVPTIEADDLADLLFAQGYAVASERMWQMDLMRRLAGGRLAEVMGPEALAADRLFRTIGLGVAARASLADLDEAHRRMLADYARGVNAYQEQARGRLPLEYRLAGFAPAPWRPEDSLVIGAYMAWILSFNARAELTYLNLAARLGNERAAELFPTDEGIRAPAPHPDLPRLDPDLAGALGQTIDRLARLPARFGLPMPGAASNGWALAGERTRDGQALLANDPHLAASMPGIWYLLELESPEIHVAGAALPGVPFVMIGHNDDLAWGFATTMADTQDLFLERVTADGAHVERPDGRPEAIRERIERIPVAGWDAPDELIVRSTSHGVILNPVLGAGTGTAMDLPAVDTGFLLTLRWTTDVPDRAFAGLQRLNMATSLADARAAILDFRHVSQTLLLAHRDGGIGWQVSGRLPVRKTGDGVFPSPGWAAGVGWGSYVPPDENPGGIGPPDQVLIAANHRIGTLDDSGRVGRVWMAPYRAQRIAELLATDRPLGAEDLVAMQFDRVAIEARRYHQALARLVPDLQRLDPTAAVIAERLLAWDGEMNPASPEAALAVLLEPALYRALFGPALGDELTTQLMALSTSSYSPLLEAVRSGRSSFWDDGGGQVAVWTRALRIAAEEAAGRRLDQVRTLSFPHAFDRIPWIGRLFSVGPIGLGGGSQTVNVAKAAPHDPGRILFIPSLRVVYTPGDWGRTRGSMPLGQSGHRLSRYRTDQLDDWLSGRTYPWPWHGPAPEQTIGTARLHPRD